MMKEVLVVIAAGLFMQAGYNMTVLPREAQWTRRWNWYTIVPLWLGLILTVA